MEKYGTEAATDKAKHTVEAWSHSKPLSAVQGY